MKVAFATRDLERVDERFDSAPRLAVYDVTDEGARLERACVVAPQAPEATDDVLGPRVRAIAGCALVFVAAIGPSTAARLASHGIRPATAPAGTRIHDLLSVIRELLSRGAGLRPPPDEPCAAT
jgi:nitrogen fixation protein NifX